MKQHPPASFSTLTLPNCASTRPLVTASPRPALPSPGVLAASTAVREFENTIQVLFGDPAAAVGDRHARNSRRLVCRHGYADLPARRRVPDGVVDEILHRPSHLGGGEPDDRGACEGGGQLHTLCPRKKRPAGHHVGKDLVERDRTEL